MGNTIEFRHVFLWFPPFVPAADIWVAYTLDKNRPLADAGSPGRKVRRDGIHFQGLRYLSLTLAAYVGEEVTIRFDPRDMGEIRVFYQDRFLCPAVSAELAGETIPLRDIIRVHNQRRRELSSLFQDRQRVVDSLLQLKRGTAPKEIHAKAAVLPVSGVRIKRYRNE
jgi:putative transposase